jgi:hypothetical protein
MNLLPCLSSDVQSFPSKKIHGNPHHSSSHLSATMFEISLLDGGLGVEAKPIPGVSTVARLLPTLTFKQNLCGLPIFAKRHTNQ